MDNAIEPTLKDVDVCLTSQERYIFGTPLSFIQCDRIKALICKDGITPEKCNKSTVDYSKAPELHIRIGETDVMFTP